MSIYFEGDGKSRAVTMSECRDQFMHAVKEMRDEVLNNPELEAYEDTVTRDVVIANNIIGGMLGIVEGHSPYFPACNLIAYVPDEDVADAKAAGANYIDLTEFTDFGQGLQEYWKQVNS